MPRAAFTGASLTALQAIAEHVGAALLAEGKSSAKPHVEGGSPPACSDAPSVGAVEQLRTVVAQSSPTRSQQRTSGVISAFASLVMKSTSPFSALHYIHHPLMVSPCVYR